MPNLSDITPFEIGDTTFWCIYEISSNGRYYWYSHWGWNPNDLFDIDVNKGFTTKEACETYIRKQVIKWCKASLKDK